MLYLLDDNYVFKWVKETFIEEIQQLDYQVQILGKEGQVLKVTIRSEGPKIRPKIMILGCSLIPIVIVTLGIWMYKS